MLRFVLLGLLAAEPCYGYELKEVFERFLGGTWSLNSGQVYSTLSRLEDDGLVSCQVVPQDGVPDRKVYSLTDEGQSRLDRWLGTPDHGPVRLRDELFLKILVASLVSAPLAKALISRQRKQHLRALADLDHIQDQADLHPSTSLLLEGAALRLEADLRWLDLCDERTKGEVP